MIKKFKRWIKRKERIEELERDVTFLQHEAEFWRYRAIRNKAGEIKYRIATSSGDERLKAQTELGELYRNQKGVFVDKQV